jgi:hypothetical protein
MGNSLKSFQTFPEEARKLIGDEIQLMSKLPVQGFKALLFAVATYLANAIVSFTEAMTIKARKIGHFLHESPGVSALRSGSERMQTHFPALEG